MMKYRTIGAMPPGYISPNPIQPNAPPPSGTPLPPGSSVDVGVENTGGWDVNTFANFLGTGADMAEKGGIDLGPVAGFDFGAAFKTVAGMAALGAVGGVPGMVVGAIVGIVMALGSTWEQLNNPNWFQVGPGIHQFCTRYVPSKFVADAQANGTNTWQTVNEVVRALFAWWLKDGVVLTGQDNTHYHADPFANDDFWVSLLGGAPEARKFYADVGVDWDATRAQRTAAGIFVADQNVMMYKINVNVPGNAARELDPGSVVPPGAGAVYGQDLPIVPAALALGAVMLLLKSSTR